MSEARCTLHVRGLDCPKEVDSLSAALNDQAGVARLGFDLIHGTMTIDYDDALVDPGAMIRRISEQAGLSATLEGDIERTVPTWWSRHGRWAATGGSGLALAVGTGLSWFGRRSASNHPRRLGCHRSPMPGRGRGGDRNLPASLTQPGTASF